MHPVLHSQHEPHLVVVSVLIAIAASYTALDVVGRITAARGRLRVLWCAGGALAMGIGIWSMHYMAMLAFHLPVPVFYHLPTVALSLLAATFASAVALTIVSRNRMSLLLYLPSSVVMGGAIAAMHYIGMAAMRLPAAPVYDPGLVVLSVVIAIVVSFVAHLFAFHFRGEQPGRRLWRKLGSAVLMGAAIPSMHFTAMAAVSFRASPAAGFVPSGVSIPALGRLALVLITFVVLGLAMLSAVYDRRLAAQAEALATSEHALRAQEQIFRAVLDATPHLVFARDREGRYMFANQAFAKWSGVADVVGRRDLEFHPPSDDLARALEHDRQVIDSGEVRGFPDTEVTVPSTGERRWYEVVKVPLHSETHPLPLALCIATDITRRRRLEAQLAQAQKMEAVGLLAGGVAHDFNNMLTAIMGRTDLLLEEGEPGTTDPRRSDLLEIRRAAERAAGLTHQLLAFSRRQVLQSREFDLNGLLDDLLVMLRRLIGEDIELRLVSGRQPAPIKADPGQIEQVVMNLVVNSRDAMPQGGRLVLEVGELMVKEGLAAENGPANPGRYVVLAVRDNGVGMTPEVRARLFEPFFTTKRQGKGTGLGLATVYGIVKQSGGHIWVYSEPGLGTTVKLYFPRATASPEPFEPASESSAPLRGSETILVVEDEDLVRRVTCTTLGRRGYKMLVASTGDEALQLAIRHQGPIDLLLTDVVMPQMSGRELAEKMQELRPEARVLFVSGYTPDDVLRHGVLEEGVPFLQKPFSPDGLAGKVREVLGMPQRTRRPASLPT